MADRTKKIGLARGLRPLTAIALCAPTPLVSAAFAQDGDAPPPPPQQVVTDRNNGVFAPSNERPRVRVSEHMTVDMHLRDENLGAVLQMLGMQAERNIVASEGINSTVTADLYGVTFYQALDAILHVNGYGYVERGEFIYVYTLEDIEKIQMADRKPVARVIQLDYLNATDAAQFVTPLLTPSIGQIKANGDAGNFQLGENPTGGEKFALASTLVVYDYPENIKEIEDLVRRLDTRPAQVLVEATILQTQLNEANAFGVDFSIVGDLNLGDFVNLGGPLTPAAGLQNPPANNPNNSVLTDGSAIVSTPGNTNGPSTLKVGFLGSNVSVFIRLLDEVGDTTIMSNPKVLALNRQPARVLVGARIGYLSTTTNDTSTTQTVEFMDTGTQLAFRPFISNDGMIRMELKPSVSEAVLRDVIDSNGQANTIPDELTQEITTNVLVRDGSTIVLGGLFKETVQLSRRQVPVVGDIPLIGVPFRGQDDSTNRNEVIFLITPTIVNEAILAEAGKKGAQAADDALLAAREGLLPWSRERQTAKLNVEAAQLAREGDTEKALWKLRRSLELNPDQPDAVRLRQELVGGEKDAWPSRSLLKDILHEGFDAGIEPPKVTTEHGVPPADQTTAPAPAAKAPNTPVAAAPESAEAKATPVAAEPLPPAAPPAEPVVVRKRPAGSRAAWPWFGPLAWPGHTPEELP